MAKMVPSEWEDRNGSDAERLVYRKLRDETPGDWFAVHSVGLTSHAHKPWAEIDFVVVGPFGVLCLEVKGGHITVREGKWATNGSPLKESPFRQAGTGAAALHNELRDLFPALSRAVVDYGVVLPATSFSAAGVGIERRIVYDDGDLDGRFESYLQRVAKHWLEYHGRDGERFRPLSRSERAAITAYLAPSFDLVPTLRARVSRTEAELVQLTRNQSRVLRGLRTKERAIIRGGAGTGKTLLAVDEALRLAAEGRRVLFCCRSEYLSQYIARHLEEDLVDVLFYEALLRELVDAADRWNNLPDADESDLLSVFLPEQAAEAAIDLERAGSYGALVIDEAQDLLLEGALDVFDLLLDGGLPDGMWRVFLDHKQNVFSAVDRSQFERLTKHAVTEFDLVDNCRNTPQICDTTAMLSAVDPDEALAEAGPEVELRFVLDRKHDAFVAGSIVRGWLRKGVRAEDIVVIATDVETKQRMLRSWPSDAPALHALDGGSVRGPLLAVAGDFKGLEASAILVVGVCELGRRETLRRMYVACSRARALLGVVIHESARDDFDLRAVEYARRRTSTSEQAETPTGFRFRGPVASP